MKKALITGITGQDGSFLAEQLRAKNYEVHGLIRRTPTIQLPKGYFLHYADLLDQGSLIRLLKEVELDEVYNLASQSHVKMSFESPVQTADVTGLGALRMLEAIRETGKKAKFYQASSSDRLVPNYVRVVRHYLHPFQAHDGISLSGHVGNI